MIAVLQHHDDAIHFDPLDTEDQEERKRAKLWVVGNCTGKPPGTRGHTHTHTQQKPIPAPRVRVFLRVLNAQTRTRTRGGFTRGYIQIIYNVAITMKCIIYYIHTPLPRCQLTMPLSDPLVQQATLVVGRWCMHSKDRVAGGCILARTVLS
jgi:hypothetical protein